MHYINVNNKRDSQIINLNKMAVPKKAYLLSFFSRHYHRIMKLKCKAVSLFSCNCVSHMTNYVNFKLSKDVEKNPGPTQYNTDHHEIIIIPFMQNHSSTMQLNSPISSENLMQSRLGALCLQSIDVGGAGDCFFRSVSHQLYGNSNHHMHIRTAGVQFMRDNPERFIETNAENSWLRYLNNMCIQGTWADALIIQAVADALNVTMQIVESNQGFAPLTTVYPVQERNSYSTITIGHIDECHYVSTTALQSTASISMCNELTNDTQSSINKHFIMSIYITLDDIFYSGRQQSMTTKIYFKNVLCLLSFQIHSVFAKNR